MYRYLFRNKLEIILYMLLAPVSALCTLAVSAGMAMAIDYANGGDLSDAWKYLIMFSAYVLVDFCVDYTFENIRHRLSKKAVVGLKSDIYHKVVNMRYDRFTEKNTADYIANMTTDIDVLRNSYFSVILALYMDVFRFAFATIALFWISPILGTFILVISLVQTAIPILNAKRLEKAGKHYSDSQEKQMRVLKENLNGFLTAKTFHIESLLEDKYSTALHDAEEKNRSLKMLKILVNNVSFAFSRIAHLGIFLIGAILSIKGLLTTAEIVAVSELIIYISNPIYFFNSNLADLRSANPSVKKLEAILQEENDVPSNLSVSPVIMDIVVSGLTFRYGDTLILDNLSHIFQAGKKYLITGASGCGKSTLLTLISGLRRDYSGKIMLGNSDLSTIDREKLTRYICYTPQVPFLFDDTLYNNICLFQNFSKHDVQSVLKRVGLEGFCDKLDRPLGENAATVSGGERQRIAIARALLHGAQTLLLDESTSQLDPKTASEIEHFVLGLEDITVLLVSHNATEVAKQMADEILFIKDGKINNYIFATK